MKSIFTIFALAVGISVSAFGQTAEQREVIKSSMKKDVVTKSINQTMSFNTQRVQRVNDYLLAHPDQKKSFLKNGKAYLLYNVLPDGTPIFITTKDKNQQSNSKSVSLYNGGSIGVNVSGTNMVAGVWDGGQVNANHETLQGKVEMQPGQTLDESGDNAHQTAVTGIMVGKLNNSAQGIAFDATTKNFDWDNDLIEMNAFSNEGYLISNHSYGPSNDSTIPVWLFGAYDESAAAFDALLKSKPFYLPFTAGGNEQQKNGNMSAGGYDIMTSSAAAKNGVTVGAINNDDAMSDYSNWGPTDDGRIKPDIVTLGTAIDAPLYDNDQGYTGNVIESSGTSYSSPAAAACALLLQQYYYSLNNAFMKSSMLKALLLHSADDDASGNGPDAQFGWGILNIENAAEIIRQNSLTNGTSRMVMVEVNPANDGTEEISDVLVFASGNARVSLCWTDDEGVKQTEEQGINPTDSRMVYNFSMKFEQTDPPITAWPYNNLDVTNPSVAAVQGSDWFQSANNYIQANLIGTTENANGRISIRKSTTSPSSSRGFAFIISGLKDVNVSVNDNNLDKNILFYDRNENRIKLIGNSIIEEYQIYSIDGRLKSSGIANSNEIIFDDNTKNVYILKYKIGAKSYTYKFVNY